MTEDSVANLFSCYISIHHIRTLLSKIGCFNTHYVGTNQHLVFLAENHLAQTIGLSECKSLSVGTEEALTDTNLDAGCLALLFGHADHATLRHSENR